MAKRKDYPVRETLKHREAFEYYLYLGKDRTLKKVAEMYKVKIETVRRWSSKLGWKEKIAQREQEIAAKFQKRNEDEILKAKRENLKIIRDTKKRFVQALKRGLVNPLTTQDLERIIKLENLLIGEPTERTETLDKEKVKKEIEEIFGA